MEYNYPVRFGKYLLTRRLAVGGMAEVFKGKLIGPKGFEKTLALKRILPEFGEDEEFVQMFVDEARISSNLHHKNIVQVFDFGEVARSYYIAMEFVDGPNLKNLLQRCVKDRGRFPRDYSLYIALQIAEALEYAHNVRVEGKDVLNLIHRDVSPQNVLVSRDGEVKITDFGIAKATIKLSHTQPGKIQGKLSYMSPEQAVGRALDRRSDIFSLGVIMFELFSGVKVYAGEDTIQRYNEVREAKIPRLATLVPDLPSQAESLVMRMLSKDPADRPQSCAEVIRELSDVMGGISLGHLPGDIGTLISELFPQEPSDSGIGRRVAEIAERNAHDREGATDVDHAPPLERSRREGVTKPAIGDATILSGATEIFGLKRQTWRPVILLSLLAAVSVVWFLFHERPDRETPIGTPENASSGDLPLAAANRRGPVDADLMSQIQSAEARARQLEQDVQQANREVEEAGKKLEQKDRQIEELAEAASVIKPPCPSDMVLIHGGTFYFGSDRSDSDRNDLVEKEAEQFPVQSFCIDRYEYPNRKGGTPVAGVTWAGAQASCTKHGKRLCAQEEWERTCKGPLTGGRNRRYPYGETGDPLICNTKGDKEGGVDGERAVAGSGTFERCVTKEGVFDMSGNVDEWTLSPGQFNSESRVTKGGSSHRPIYQARCPSVREVMASTGEPDVGFRCCKDAI
ncbi:MAG: bifunctional serine/threonine-protein kinase/formylglycine-generating enzyme family protein [Pseudomonadota bacterium]